MTDQNNLFLVESFDKTVQQTAFQNALSLTDDQIFVFIENNRQEHQRLHEKAPYDPNRLPVAEQALYVGVISGTAVLSAVLFKRNMENAERYTEVAVKNWSILLDIGKDVIAELDPEGNHPKRNRFGVINPNDHTR